jgi:nucleoside-diphosphate-sugar epimerase
MEAPKENLRIWSSYNLSGISFTPDQLAKEIQKHIPDFIIRYEPDFRQTIADSWPNSIDDSYASEDWKWKPAYNLSELVSEMLHHI